MFGMILGWTEPRSQWKVGYDFTTWTSFPSSVLQETEMTEPSPAIWSGVERSFKVVPGYSLTVSINMKCENIRGTHVLVWVTDENRKEKFIFDSVIEAYVEGEGTGTYNWKKFKKTWQIPKDPKAKVLVIGLEAGWRLGPPPKAKVWFDDLKIYQDGKLIYEDNFSNWSPYLGSIPVAVVGGVIGFNEAKKLIKI